MAAADREGGSRSQGLLYGGGGRSMESIVSGGQWPGEYASGGGKRCVLHP